MLERNNGPPDGGSRRYYLIAITTFFSLYILSVLDYESVKLGGLIGTSETKKSSTRVKSANTGNSTDNSTGAVDPVQLRKTNYERLRPQSACLSLPEPTNLTHPVSVGACCGIGHRLCFNLPTFVWAIQHGHPISVSWPDVSWGILFKDTPNIKSSNVRENDHYDNGYPPDWLEGIPEYTKAAMPTPGTSFAQYNNQFPLLFDMPLAQSLVRMLQCSLSATVLSFLHSICEQSLMSELHLCAHVREGNNETGDWERKTWRHVDLYSTLNSTLSSMQTMANARNASNVTVFIASDNPNSRPWFENNVPSSWNVIRPAKVIKKPESGVWFGEHGSTTGAALSQEQKDEAMAEAVSDIFGLGECDALWIPNYSSFTLISIIMMRAERRPVNFMHHDTSEFVELPNIPEVEQVKNTTQ